MSKLSKVEPIVKEVLEKYELTRNDDFLLVAEVYHEIIPTIANMPFGQVMLCHKKLKLPPTKTIERARRKLQAEYEELRPSKEVEEARTNEEAEYINYAIGGYSSSFMKFVDSQK